MAEQITDLLCRCKRNDRQAQRELFAQYRLKVHSIVFKSLGPKYDIDDVIQQIFIEIFKSIDGFKGDASFDTWVYRISFKVCTTQLRKKYRKRQPQIVYNSDQVELNADDVYNPLAQLERREIQEAIREAIHKLDPEKRMTIIMSEMENCSIEEIAEVQQVPLGTAKSRLFNARKQLAKALQEYWKK